MNPSLGPSTHPAICFALNSFITHLWRVLFKVTNKFDLGPPQSPLAGTLFPGVNISAGEIHWTEPAGIWHFSDISILPSPFFVHAPTCKQHDGFTQKLGFFCFTMGDWETHNLLQSTGCKNARPLNLSSFRSHSILPTLFSESEIFHQSTCAEWNETYSICTHYKADVAGPSQC